ncbi:MAG: CehA/McbA family metallohydrolase [Gemmataceae bacterium]
MRSLFLAAACFAVLGACVLLAAPDEDRPIPFRLVLVEPDGKSSPGIVRVLEADTSRPVPVPGLVDRLVGFKVPEAQRGWVVLPSGGAEIALPRGSYTIEALSGLETDKTTQRLDLKGPVDGAVKVPLRVLFRPAERGLVAGNTHLHLMKIGKKQADDYLRAVPAADRLKVLFISYLERKPDDKDYITNTYPLGPLTFPAPGGGGGAGRGIDATGVLYSNGEEHRHNFKAYGEGYGHVMFLNIKDLVKPVSIGPGIMLDGVDDAPLKGGVDEARRQKGTVIWCHNTLGYEAVLNALAGRLDALNVFDGSRKGDYEQYYRYLNVGLKLPISTGTDWFIYDFSRVYAALPAKEKLTVPTWLEALRRGRCQATNGPLLDLRVDGRTIGDTLKLDGPTRVKIEASGLGRVHFGKLQLIHNGKVIATKEVSATKAPFETRLEHEAFVEGPGWLALRVETTAQNELAQPLFAHTSPIYLEVKGRSLFQVDAALALLKQIEEGAASIHAQGTFSSPTARDRLLALYEQGAADLRERIRGRKGGS